MSLKKRMIIIMIIVIAIVGGAGCMNVEKKLLDDLEGKYNKEFVIEHYEKGGLFYSTGSKGISATAHVKGEEDVVFTMRERTGEKGTFNDSYLLARWGKELEVKLAADIKKNLPEGAEYRILLRSAGNTFDESMNDLQAEEFIQSNQDLAVVLIVSIKVSNEPDVSIYSEGIYNLYKLMDGVGTEVFMVSIGFVDESEDISDFLRTTFVNNIGWDNLNAKVYGIISIDERFKDMINNEDAVADWYESMEER
ncbi:hypothetical protein ACERII_21820 [Evansella sp. AB-rgal1]|uniref:hypothetical protein n=1 Tax=Evansella sp. AB-rgal1 TaxID=3242696 RepID=UPI00359D8735